MADATAVLPRRAAFSAETMTNMVIACALLAAPLYFHAIGESYYVNLASRVAILALAGVGLNIALGYGGMVSFGHAAFFGLGGYAVGVGAHHAFEASVFLSWPVTLEGTTSAPILWATALLVSGAAATIIGALSIRTTGVYFIMITLAFAQMIYYLAVSIPTYGGEDGLPIYLRSETPFVDFNDPLTFFLISYAALGLGLALSHRLKDSRFGSALIMARLNETRLATAGVEPYPIKLTAFVISAAMTGFAGALYADLNGFIGPSALSWKTSGEIMIFVILGGVGRLFGPVLGAAMFILLETFLGGVTDRWGLFLGLILLGVVLFARGGLIGLIAGPPRHD